MTNNLLRTLIFAFFLALVAAPTQAQEFGRIEGTVIGEDGEPMRGVLVKLHRTDQEATYEAKTNKKGVFLHAKLPVGTYDVALTLKDEVLASTKNIRVSGEKRPPVTFDLKAHKERQAALAAPTAPPAPSEKELAGMSKEERAAYEAAVKARQEELEKSAKLNDAFNTGMTALRAGDYASAVTALEQAAGLSQTQHVIYANLGSARSELAASKKGEERTALLTAAADSYRKAIELNPTNSAYKNNLGLALVQAGQREEGMAMLEQAVGSDPENAGKYYFNVGALLSNSGDVDGAVAAFHKATEAQPNYAAAHYQLGMALVGKASYTPDGSMIPAEGTLEAFQRYLELQPDGADAETAKAMVQTLTTSVATSLKQ